jgi:hypothetical protein
MEDHLAHMEDLIDQLSSLGETLAEQLTVALFLSSLPESYSTLITALETRPEADLTVHLVKNKLIEEFKRRNESSATASYLPDQDLQALKITQSGTRHTNSKQTSMVCFFCKKPNHLKKECRKYLEWKRKHPDHKAKAVQQYDEEISDYESDQHYCFRAGEGDSRDVWYIDSGASSHMCSNRNFFTELNDQQTGQVILADGQKLPTLGIGNGYLNCIADSQQREIKFTEVLYVPQLKGNLLSVRKLTEKQLKVVFENESCSIMMNNKQLAHASLKHGLYELNSTDFALMSTVDTGCIHVWHNRLGHRDPKAIQLLEQRLESFQIKKCQTRQICECCIQAKLTKKPLPKESETRTNAVLDIIHTDVCGPMQTVTPGGSKYFLTLIDDYSRYSVLYLLKNKSEVTVKVKEYVKFVQTKFNRTPKVIRSDNGGEYVNEGLRSFFRNEGIVPQTTVPYTPQQNGCSERKNRYLVEMVRSMLIDAGLPNKYWGEAVTTANHLQNLLPIADRPKTPYEYWEGVEPKLTHIRRFGCKAYAVTPTVRTQKLDQKAQKFTFVGYAEGTKGYRLLNTENDKITISRDVVFMEGDPHQSNPWNNGKPDEMKKTINEEVDISTNEHTVKDNDTTTSSEQQRTEAETEVRRSSRIIKRPQRLIETANVAAEIIEPKTFDEANCCNESAEWRKAMEGEICCLKQNGTWSLQELPEGKTAIGCKWVYKAKTDNEGNVTKYKARLVAQGFSQKFGEQYDEVFAPVAKPETFRLLLTIAGQRRLCVKHYDIQSAYLNGDLSHEVYMKQPEGYHEGDENLVCKLNKSLYGLKQGAVEWNRKLHDILTRNNFTRSQNDACLYSKRVKNDWMYICIHVDDLIVASTTTTLYRTFEEQMNEILVMKDLGDVKQYLGLQIERDENGVFLLHQTNYINKKLREFGLSDSKPSKIPLDPGYQKQQLQQPDMKDKEVYRQAIGSLLYLATNTRPDIAVSTSILARKVSNPSEADWTETKRVFKYLNYTKDKKLKLGNALQWDDMQLTGYADADWGGDSTERKSNSGYIFKFLGAPIVWASRKQTLVALSSTEAEYIALSEAAQEAVCLRRLLTDFDQQIIGPTVIYEDNQSCIKLLQDERSSHRTKHIATKYHFVRDLFRCGEIDVKYCPSENMTADILTKPLGPEKLRQFTQDLGLVDG